MKDLQYIGGYRHPKNTYGQGSPEFYEEEYRLYGAKSKQEFWETKRRLTPKCHYCGVPYGFNFGTGDCGCGE